MADLRLAEAEERRRAPRRRKIYFGCELPFTHMPSRITRGFTKIFEDKQIKDSGIKAHYQLAKNCLSKQLDQAEPDFRIQLMLISALTLASSTENPGVPLAPAKEQFFAPAKPTRDRDRYAASLITRMLWFLDKDAFPWNKDKPGVCSVTEMAGAMSK